MPKFAANLTMMFGEWDFLDRFAAAADAGFTSVEFLFPYEYPPEAIETRLRKNGLHLALFNLPPGKWQDGERGIAVFPERREEFEAGVEVALRYANVLGVKRLHLMSGIASNQDLKALSAYESSIAKACTAAASAAIEILIEPINPRDMAGYFLNNFDMAVDIIAKLKLPNLKLQYDIYHRQIIHGDVLTSLSALLPIIGHVQIASVPRRNEPCSGELDDARILQALDGLGYSGFVGLEYRPATETLTGLAWQSKLAK